MILHNLGFVLNKVEVKAGSNIAPIFNNLRSHLVKQGETVKKKAMTTHCSLEDSVWIEGKAFLQI